MATYTVYNSATRKDTVVKATGVVQLRKMALNGKVSTTKRGTNLVFSGNVASDSFSMKELEKAMLGTMAYHGKGVGWIWITDKKGYTISKDGTLTPLTKEKRTIIMGRRA